MRSSFHTLTAATQSTLPRVRLGLLLVALAISILVACAPARPNGSEFVGKWGGLRAQGGTDAMYDCPLDIARNGASFLLKIDSTDSTTTVVCRVYEGIYTLTPEGNLKGGPLGMVSLSFDKAKRQVVLSANGLHYLSKR